MPPADARSSANTGGLLLALVRASHAGPTAVVTTVSAVLAVAGGGRPGTVVLVTLAVLTGQLSVGWSNDAVDAARDRATGRTGKPVVAGAVGRRSLAACAVGALLVCAALSWATGAVPGTLHVVAVLSAWSYNLGLKATVWSWLPYAFSFGLLPVFVLGAAGSWPAPWVAVVGAALGVGAHLLNAAPDLEDDLATGVRGMPHRLGRTRSVVLAPAVLATGVVVAWAGAVWGGAGGTAWWWGAPASVVLGGLAVAAVLLAVLAGATAARRPSSRAPFGASMAVAALCVVLLAVAGRGALTA